MSKFSRRDFIKLATLAAIGAFMPKPALRFVAQPDSRRNFIIILFDAMSAANLSLYGYQRSTTPNLAKFAESSTVFHSHYSGGNFTTAGTGAMLTGMYPWTNRAFNPGALIKREYLSNNPYTLLGSDYFRFAFSQNPWPDRLVSQFYGDVDLIIPPTSYNLRGNTLIMDKLGRDRALASIAMEEFLFSTQAEPMGSSLLGYVYKSLNYRGAVYEQGAHEEYSKGIPEVEGFSSTYLNEDVYRGVLHEIKQLEAQEKPYFAYFHLYSPHSPYRPREDFLELFHDDFKPLQKPVHPLGMHKSERDLLNKRTAYDQQIAQVDFEFGNLVSELDALGILDNTHVFVTSDHGEMFERGFLGHGGLMLYEPNIRIPLVIHAPGQRTRVDVHQPTSNVDIVPTILSLAGRSIPQEMDGRVLPEFGGVTGEERPIFSMTCQENSAFAPLEKGVFSMRRGKYKIIAYFGYKDYEGVFEVYDLERDPDELNDLSIKDTLVFDSLKAEFLAHLDRANLPYARK